jgi:branched-chain amino acid transport system ATP-binding protein
MLTLDRINVFYGAIHALHDVSLTVNKGEVVTLIGANGAGKSTTLRAITGLLTPRSGRITFEGQDITGIPAHKLVARGISMSPEGRGVFANLTVLENLEMGAYLSADKAAVQRGLDSRVRDVPAAGGAPQAAGRHAVWRRTADAGDGARADVAAEAAAAR